MCAPAHTVNCEHIAVIISEIETLSLCEQKGCRIKVKVNLNWNMEEAIGCCPFHPNQMSACVIMKITSRPNGVCGLFISMRMIHKTMLLWQTPCKIFQCCHYSTPCPYTVEVSRWTSHSKNNINKINTNFAISSRIFSYLFILVSFKYSSSFSSTGFFPCTGGSSAKLRMNVWNGFCSDTFHYFYFVFLLYR